MELPTGRIVWAPVLDLNGKNLKIRPLVVVETPTADRFAAVAVTTSIQSFEMSSDACSFPGTATGIREQSSGQSALPDVTGWFG